MAESTSMVASAVIVPEPAEHEQPSSVPNTLKRRQSSSSESGGKRARLSPETGALDELRSNTTIERSLPATTIERVSNGIRRGGRGGKDDERSRGKRLFGSVLGTLSQSASSTAQKRRAEIEKKQQAKLRLQSEADDEEKRQRLDNLVAARKIEQIRYDAQCARIVQSNALAMAYYLQTRTEPRLYFKPWKTRPQEKAQIERQIREVELQYDEALAASPKQEKQSGDNGPTDNIQLDGNADDTALSKDITSVGSEVPENAESSISVPAPDTNHDDAPSVAESPNAEQSKENGDDNDEMVIEAGEDAVIY